MKIVKKIVALLSIAIMLVLALLTTLAASFSHTPVSGVDVSVSTDNGSSSMTNGAITVTTAGGSLLSKTSTITITNSTGAEATISFSYAPSGEYSSFKVAGTSKTSAGTYSTTLAAKGTITVSITSSRKKSSQVVLSDFGAKVKTAASDVKIQFNSLGSVTADDSAIASNDTISVGEAGVLLEAFPSSGAEFIGWMEVSTHKLLSLATSYTLESTGDTTIEAVFVNENSPTYFSYNDSYLYDNLLDAIEKAVSSGTIILMNNGSIPVGNYTIPAGVTLLIPYNDAHTVIKNDMGSYVSSATTVGSAYRQLTMKSGTSITVNGDLCVGSQAAQQMVGQVGNYGSIVMEEGSSITVNGALYAYGYIFHGTDGSGTVSVSSTGTVYECAFIMDYTGSASSAESLYDDSKIFPMRAYTVRCVEVPMTFQHGAVCKGFYSMYMNNTFITKAFPNYLTLISDSSDDSPVFLTKTGATITKSYTDSKQIFDLNGDMSLCSASVTVNTGIWDVTFKSSETSGLILPSGYIINYGGGTMTLLDNVIMSEGTKITVKQGGTIDANGKVIYILDADEDPGAKSATDVHGNAYTQVKTDAVIDCNGTAIIDGGLYASKGKASIISSKGTGVVFIKKKSDADKSLSFKSSTSTATSITVYPAWFQNANASYESHISTGEYGVATYRYDKNTERWYSLAVNATNANTDQTKIDIEYRVQDYLWFNGVCYLGTADNLKSESLLSDVIQEDVIVNCYDATNNKWVAADEYVDVVVVNNAVYLVKKIPSDQIPNDLVFLLKYNVYVTDETTDEPVLEKTYLSVPFTVSFAAYADAYIAEHKDDPAGTKTSEGYLVSNIITLLEKMKLYGQASEDYFGKVDITEAEKFPEEIGTVSGAPQSVSGSRGSLATGEYIATKGATFFFDERISMTMQFALTKDKSNINLSNLGTVTQIGLLVGDTADLNGALLYTSGNYDHAYLLYNSSALSESNGSVPTLPSGTQYNNGTYSVVTDFSEISSNSTWSISFDLASADYATKFALRSYIVIDNTPDKTDDDDYTVLYGTQYSYGLADYLARTYHSVTVDAVKDGCDVEAYKNLMVAAWHYMVAAEAAFGA